MEKTAVLEALKTLKEGVKKRNFSQTYDLIVTLKNFNIKKTEYQIEFFAGLPHPNKKAMKVCAVVGPELKAEAEANCDTVILASDLDSYANKKKEVKKLAEDHTYFIAQANFMGKLASVFGKVLGPRGKMPNPKAGCVVPPKANLKPVIERLSKNVKVTTKKVPMIQVSVGHEGMSDEQVAENIVSLYNSIVTHLPQEVNNVKQILVKFTMSKPVEIGK